MDSVLTVVVVFISAIAIALLIGFLLAFPLMLLWNGCLVGAVAGVSEITWLQAWGISILCNFLFKTTVSSK